jgi:flagellar basal body rod protein FlgG
MATQELPTAKYLKGGQMTTLDDFDVMEETRGFEEDGEDYFTRLGQFNSRINYSRRQTVSAQCNALSDGGSNIADPEEYLGGQIESGTVKLADGSTDSAWHIRDARIVKTRGPQRLELDLIQLGDMLD